jgi:hypothetical protein
LVVALLCAATVTSACTSRSDHAGGKETSKETGHVIRNAAAGVWELDREKLPSATSTKFVALVSRLGCNNGVTGKAVKPVVKMSKSQIVVTFQVTPGKPKAANCPGNNSVPYEVKLGEPIAGRQLIDGRCLPGGEAEPTSLCEPSRWKLLS